MKHSLKITLYLISLFFLTQLIGLAVVNQYIDITATATTGTTVIYEETYNLSGITPPPIENESISFMYVLAGVLIGTILILLIIKFKKKSLWKSWFFLSVVVCLIVAWVPFVQIFLRSVGIPVAWTLMITLFAAVVLSVYKVYRQNIIIHNLTEIFIYGGLAAILVPRINILSVTILLIAISVYDMYAVWKSKHMIAMATFQSNARIFAGLLIPYKKQSSPKEKGSGIREHVPQQAESKEAQSAVLGGGDLAFPLLFSSVIMKTTGSYSDPVIISVVATITLGILLSLGKKGRFYPAMPFLTLGCFVGYGISLLL